MDFLEYVLAKFVLCGLKCFYALLQLIETSISQNPNLGIKKVTNKNVELSLTLPSPFLNHEIH